MALNFPDSPTLNQTFSSADRTWKWDGSVWLLQSAITNLDSLTDVVITSPATSQGLFYNGTAWVNSTHTHVKADITDFAHTHDMPDLTAFTVTSPVTGQILSYNGTKWVNAEAPATGFDPFLLMGA